jgi:hypothetical protein
MISSLAATRVIFVLGIINLASGLLVFFTCRCLPGSRIGKGLTKYRWYRGLFKIHCYIWWVFWISVIAHAIFVLIYIGQPF